MSMIYEPAKKTVGELLGDVAKKTSVPDYQRDYSWTDNHVDYFLQDVLGFMRSQNERTLPDAEYFIGSMVRVDKAEGYELLDGQQRLATAVILLSSIRDSLPPLNAKASIKTQERWIAEEDDRTGDRTYSLTLSTYDRSYFRRRIQDESATPPAPGTASQKLIDAARKKIDSELASELEQLPDGKSREEWLLFLRDVVVNHVTTVTVTCTSEQDAASIFETLNDRGLGLSTVDLLRNFVLRRAGEPEREEIVSIWGDVLSESTSVDVDEFLRHYWTSRHGDIKSQRLYRAIRKYLEESGQSSLEFMRDLGTAHAAYVRLLRPDFANQATNEELQNVADLKAKMLYPLLLSGLARGEEGFHSLVRAALIFYVREGVVAKRNSSQMEKVVFSAASLLFDGTPLGEALAVLHFGASADAVFEASIGELKGLDTSSARYLLREIEISMRNQEETDVARPPRIHVEHIYPQKPKAADRWTNHSDYVGKLGNLTLLARRINTSIKNSDFSVKRVELAKSELFITQSVAALAVWDQSAVDRRQGELGAKIKELWVWPAEVVAAAAEFPVEAED
ncbi:hypothetical protein Slala03_62570 [Streptomyces lavendulae subsp. lavendulae]|uniref:DUF262 domain-containing protein n=1 Tax=Streptomyces lavendulae TaxID=1914 RepID=UPI0024A28E10|nr:DUF262 domain-containing HNH endonuclease family protein [Streptomyces lavendulae]GLV86568.1 hypothetical protein Slala03_62570 [Streptomyces lavendulae subsp. lavendulae]